MKTKNPKCIKCNKVMKVIYTKRSFKYNNKYRTYWSKEGYICNHLYYPFVILTPMNSTKYEVQFENYLISVHDIDIKNLLESLEKIFNFLI